MPPTRSKKISKEPQIQAPEKIFINKLKGNDQVITPVSELKELASDMNSYHTIKGHIESVKHSTYKVKYQASYKIIIKFSPNRHVLNVVAV
jgi:hypothetical protein